MNQPGSGPPGGGPEQRGTSRFSSNPPPGFLSFQPSLLIVGLVVFAFLFLVVGVSYGRVPWGTSVAGVSLGGLGLNAARERLERETDVFLAQAIRIDIATGQGTVSRKISPSELGFRIDASETLAQFEESSPRLILAGALMGGTLPPVLALDIERFKKETGELFRDLEIKPINASIHIREDDLMAGEIVSGRSGTRVDRGTLFSELIVRVEKASSKPVIAPLYEELPLIKAEDLEEPLGVWQRFIRSGALRLRLEKNSWEVASTTLAKWIEFIPEKAGGRELILIGLNKKKAAPFFVSLASAIEKPALNSFLGIRDGVVEEVGSPQEGRRLLVAESIGSVERALREEKHEAGLLTETLEPDVTLAKARELGITHLVGKGESNFAGSPNNRIHNIKIGAARFRSVLIGIGGEFSFNTLLGKVDGAHGYLPELVIKKNKTIPEYGGGLCQVSTTVFRAAMAAGAPITERQNHSFIVSYYGKPGFDATIYPGSRDFRFRNDTPGPLILQMRSEGTRLIAELFGASDGRLVEIKGPFVYESNPDGSARAVLTRAIERNGEHNEEKFYSSYKPKALYPVERNPYE